MVSQDTGLGIEVLDTQHQELVDLFDAFDQCIKPDVPLDAVQSIVARALTCVNTHFECEEEMMARLKYPRIGEHKFLHRHLRMEMSTLAGGVMALMARDPVTLEQLKGMRAMLMEHIAGPDTELAAYLKASGVK